MDVSFMNSAYSGRMTWWKVSASGEDEEILSALLAGFGAEGIVRESSHAVSAFFESDVSPEEKISVLRSRFSISIEPVEDFNWTAQCEELMQPIILGGIEIIPCPSNETTPPISSSVYIIPGMGFGTGHHETTASVITLMQTISSPPQSVLDFGCGSGVLAIVAEKLFHPRTIVGIDIEPAAIDNAKENAGLNRIDSIEFLVGDTPPMNQKFDLVVCNLYAEAILALLSPLVETINGTVIFSGIVESKKDEIIAALTRYPLTLSQSIVHHGWATLKFTA